MKVLPLCLMIAVLSGCAGFQLPEIQYDEDDFEPATYAPPPGPPIEIVEVPQPLPLPGQLKPLPDLTPPSETAEPEDRVEAANASAAIEPAAAGYINAIQVYPYNRGALYQVYAAPGQVTDIALQPGEQLTAVSAGDTVRWIVGDTTSGGGESAQVRILVKPIAPGISTNLVILTNRRAYHLELHSTADTYMASVSWYYPQDELLALRARNAAAIHAQNTTIDRGLDLARLRFRYAISGDQPPWRPTRAFDDGHKVYVQFPRLDQGEAPPLFVLGKDGKAQLVNYRMQANYYIVDRLFAAAELRLGEDPQQVVRIVRTDGEAPSP